MKEKLPYNLTKREFEVLELLVLGLNNFEIAEKLCITEFTSKAHVMAIYRKLNVQKRVCAAVLAVKENIIRI